MARSGTQSVRSIVWAWPVGILIGLAIGIPVFGAKGGVAFGVALGIAFALGLGAVRSRADGDPARGGSDGRATGDGADVSGRG
ncbi:hypothetical protein GAR05_04525 [Micromonospora saelicesensis]|uniref:Uncharacterized protein n=1 Tax=Micromonospora saelicesensis TaxID=285676 RepID=A0ABX9CE84_9ACTN|nr:hypothetical protein [Micromonospora saelicesensis]RAN95261.1 hypothetical protein GAR05_04525 [Micromonospora saelicesensis]RAO43983.1 hypothetical protein PSN01_05803 [Micromonospora saelicesensis]RAO58165.1 hypothetical protein LUPAC06_02392 [Micromonospora saelicesensis]